MATERYLSPEQIAERLSLCRKTVLRKIAAREFGSQVANVGTERVRVYRVPESAVARWLESRRVFFEPEERRVSAGRV